MATNVLAKKQPQKEAGSPVDPCTSRLCTIESGCSQPPVRLIAIESVCEMLGLKRSATLRMVAEGKLPPPIKFGTSRRSAARWIEAEIIDFVMGKAAERRFVSPRPVSQRGAK